MKKTIFGVIIAIIVVLAAFRLITNRNRNISQTEEISSNSVAVSVTDVIKKISTFTLDFTGTVYPDKELDIAAETQGKITSLNFKLGQSFERGGLVAIIDDRITTLNHASAKINAERLKKELERVESLYKRALVSEQEYDDAHTSYETAKNNLDEAEKQLSYTRVTTSIFGIITNKYVEEGTYVNPGSVIASIVDISKLKVKLNVSETSVYYLPIGGYAKITTDIYPGAEFIGKISFISPRGDEAHNYPVEIEMANSNANPLKSGTFVNVSIKISSSAEGLYIPREALQESLKEAKVYVVENGMAHLNELIIGRESNGTLEVISGLEASDKVVVSGQVNLTDNRPVKIIDNR